MSAAIKTSDCHKGAKIIKLEKLSHRSGQSSSPLKSKDSDTNNATITQLIDLSVKQKLVANNFDRARSIYQLANKIG